MAASYLPDWALHTWSGPKVRLTLPPASYFKFPPSPAPAVLPSPPDNPNLAHPFTIPTDTYNALLSVNVPITVALIYLTTITYLNGVNARRGNKPWAVSKTWLFAIGVVLHNLVLAVYSAWTFVGMVNAARLSYVHHYEGAGLAGTVDALCKLHGPRGIGSAASFSNKSEWRIYNAAYHLSSQFLPEVTDVGRIWNEGLAFYGWLFYLSKLYEPVDTLISLAKGKQSSLLHTYHHAGAMICMWAGIRYMSPPIWLFVTINSFIHTVMYTFYLFSALRVHVPKPVKQLITTMQITQLVVGVTYAFSHLFIEYQIPVKTPYIVHIGQKIVENASGLGADAAAQFTSAMAAATAVADAESWLKKFALRAAGREGLAENVLNKRGQTFGVDAAHAVSDFVSREETRYHDELKWTHCLDTSGQTFAIYLNLFYLLPLTWLFVRFFVNSYLRRAEHQRSRSLSQHLVTAGRSLSDAGKGVTRRLSEAFENSQGWDTEVNGQVQESKPVIDAKRVRELLRGMDESMRNKAEEAIAEMPTVEDIKSYVSSKSQIVKEKMENATSNVSETSQTVKEKVEEAINESISTDTKETVKDNTEKAEKKVEQGAASAKDTAQQVMEQTSELVKSASQQIADSTGMDLDDVLKKAWATIDSPSGKSKSASAERAASQQATSSSSQPESSSSSSLNQQLSSLSSSRQNASSSFRTVTSSSSQEVSSTTVFESSSISKSTQDEVIDSSQVVRDDDVDTQTGEAKTEKEGLQMVASNTGDYNTAHATAVNNSADDIVESALEYGADVKDKVNRVLSEDGDLSTRDQNKTLPSALTDLKQSHSQHPSGDKNDMDSRQSTENKPTTSTLQTPEVSSSSSSSQSDPFDEFSQTRPASSSTHASPVKTIGKEISSSETGSKPGTMTGMPPSGRIPRPTNPVQVSSSLMDQSQPSESGSTRIVPDKPYSTKDDQGRRSNQSRERSSQRPQQRSASPAKRSRSMIPAPTVTKATTLTSMRKASPSRNFETSSSFMIHPSPTTSISISKEAGTEDQPANDTDTETERTESSSSPQSPKWHSRRRGQKHTTPIHQNDSETRGRNDTADQDNTSESANEATSSLENSIHLSPSPTRSSATVERETSISSQTNSNIDVDISTAAEHGDVENHKSRKEFNTIRDEIEDVTHSKGDDDSLIL